MAKHIFSYLAPVVGVLTLVYCDAVYVYIRLFLTPPTTAIYDYTLVGVLNILVLLAFWSLFATIVSDPGYTPLNYQCNPKLMSKTVAALYRFARKNKDTVLMQSDSEALVQQKFTCLVPLDLSLEERKAWQA